MSDTLLGHSSYTRDSDDFPLFDPDFPQVRLNWDSTSLLDLHKDPMNYYFKRVKHWGDSGSPLAFGRAYHSVLELRDLDLLEGNPIDLCKLKEYTERFAEEEGLENYEDKYRTPDKLWELVQAYCSHYSHEPWFPFYLPDSSPSIEVNFVLPLFLPDGSRLRSPSGRPYWICGYFDGLRKKEDRLVFWERKHTATTVDSYLKGFSDDLQLRTYAYAIHLLYPNLGVRTGMIDASQILLQKEPQFRRISHTISRADIEGHSRDIASWIKFAEVMALGSQANLSGLEPWWPRNRSRYPLDFKMRGVLEKEPGVREAFMAGSYEQGEPWNPAIPR